MDGTAVRAGNFVGATVGSGRCTVGEAVVHMFATQIPSKQSTSTSHCPPAEAVVGTIEGVAVGVGSAVGPLVARVG